MIRSITFCMNRRLLFIIFYVFVLTAFSFAQNAIVTENANAGNPISEWGVPDFRDNRIAGFATKMSLNRGQTVRFKINVQSGANYTIKIYRIGYYGGNGGRLMQNLGTFTGTVQPNGITNSTTGMLDCGNWSESASWAIPSNAVSGLYIAKLERTGGGSNHILFIVRNDASNSDLYLQFPDATWQAYNGYGGNSMYDGNTAWPSGHAVKASYNRPFFPYNSLFNTDGRQADWYMNATYPMIRWLERNGYDVTYTSSNDVDNNGGRLLNHKVFINLGHEEYVSKDQRNHIEAARNAGVHLAFFTGNEVYWKTRWESNDGSEDRTLVCYKEGTMADGTINERACGTKCDVSTSEWTGLWRMGANYDAGKPENALVGQISWVEYPSEIAVPAFYKKLRFWRNTSVANLSAGQTAALGINTLGYEWDYEQPAFASSNAPGRITMSSKTVSSLTHKLSLYRHSSGALVFGAGTVQWSWGLDGQHWGGSTTISPEMQQATVNLFADMGAQPGTLQPGLSSASQSTDATLPTSSITSPSTGSSVAVGAPVTFSGIAADAGGGVVAAVEVSTDGGSTWSQATVSAMDGNITWSYTWTAGPNGNYAIRTRGVDDSGNIGTATGITLIVGTGGGDITAPTVSSVSPSSGSTGVSINTTVSANFSESVNSSTVTGTTFQLKDAGNNVIAASVSTSSNQITLTPSAALNNLATYTVTIKGGASGVKDLAGNALLNDYTWSFTTVANADNIPPTVSSVLPENGTTGIYIYTNVTASFSEAINASTVTGSTFQLRDAGSNIVGATVSSSANQITLTPTTALTVSSTYTVTIVGGASGVKDLAGNALASNYSWSFTTGTVITPPPVTLQSFTTKTGTAATVHSLTGVPAGALLVLATTADVSPANCSVSSAPSLTWTKRVDAAAPSSDNAEIWTAVYTAGGTITVTSNWGEHSQASVCYVVLNAESSLGGASAIATLQSAPSVTMTTTRDNSIIFGCTADWKAINGATRTLRDAATERLYFKDGNYTTYYYTKAAATIGAYTEGVSLPTGQQSCTALLEIRSAAAAPDITPPTVSSVTPLNGATGVPVSTTATAVFNEAMDATTINGSTIELRNASNTLITASISYNAGTKTATVTPSVALTNSTLHTVTVKGGASGVKDAGANALASDYSWSFTTEVGDIVPPTVSSVTPANGATGVLVSTTASAIFDEAMDATTINNSTIELRNSSNLLITATVSYNAGTKTATVTPSAALVNSMVYTVTITGGAAGIKDLAGNAVASDYTWSFTTEVGDIIPPVISSVTPANGATEVIISTNASAIFDEAMDATTINGSTMELRNASNVLITAVVSYNAGTKTATLTPSASLANLTLYTVTIKGGSSGVKDVAGNALAGDYNWSFTTEVGDIVPPTVSSVAPVNGATDVLTSTTASAIFNEPMDATTINSSTVELRNASNVVITAAVSYNAGTKTVTLSPAASLANSTVYSVTIKGGVAGAKDVAGNALAIDYNWSFTTEAGDITPPTTSSVTPVNGATGVPVSTSATAVFNEAMDATTINSSTIQLRNSSNSLMTATVSYNTGTRTATLTPSAALANSIGYTVTIQGGASGVKDIAGNALASDDNWSFTTVAGDIIAPTVTSVAPANGATGVSVNTSVTANFSETINSSTVTGTTFQLRDAGNNLIGASVSASGSLIILTPSSELTASTSYTATITGGASGVKDLSGNALATTYSWSFTTAGAGGGATYTLFPASSAPAVPLAHDGQGIELGMRFRTTQNGFINGIRYYKGPGTTGTHTGSLWNNAGTTRLAQATFTSETASGWQEVLFSSPVAITAGVTYVASFFSPSGDYSATKPYFTQNITNGPLIGLADGTDGANGLYTYTTTSGFPGSTYQSSNYWVDVVFATNSDNTAPTVLSASPTGGATGVSTSSTITAAFSEAVNSSTVTSSTFQLRDAGNNLVSATVTTLFNQIILTPSSPLSNSIVYTATIMGGASGVKDLAGNAMVSNYSWSFTTMATVDNTAPLVTSVTPASEATGVSIGTNITATFSEAISSSTVTTGTFQLRDASNNLVSATVSTLSNQITLTPSSPLSNSIVYTATITGGASGVKDPAGNEMASNYSWSFTTMAVDNTPPAVTSVSPASGATGVSTGANITATFSEAINSSTVTTGTFQLRDASNNLVSATVSTLSNQITLTPSSELSGSTVYTATITGGLAGVKDLAGNALVNNFSWSFTTGTVTSEPVTIHSFTSKTGIVATAHSLTGVPAGALLVLATTVDASPSDCNVSSSPSLTWTKRADAGAPQSDNAEIWTAVYAAGGSITVTSNWGEDKSQASVCYVVLNAEASLGGASAIATLQAAPSVTITTTRANSIIFGCTADWKAINGATRTLRDAATERLYFKDGNYTTYYYTKAAASIAAYTEGVSLPTGQQASTALLEIRGAGIATRPVNPVVTAVTMSNSIVYSHSLGQNYPNPFNGGTRIPFTLSKAEKVNLVLLDINGRVVKVVLNALKDAGAHALNLNAGSLAKGIYYYRIQAGDFTDVKKLIIW